MADSSSGRLGDYVDDIVYYYKEYVKTGDERTLEDLELTLSLCLKRVKKLLK